uniref:Piwi domain-containing protein n=1 Tax=Ditylenchus dipsaci TaxID=166011 RepID=A0A915EGI0_9BILA
MFCGYQRDALDSSGIDKLRLRNSLRNSTVENLRREIENARKSNCDFVLMIHPDNQDEMHHAMKYDERKSCDYSRSEDHDYSKCANEGPASYRPEHFGGLNYTLPVRVSSITQEVLASETLFIGHNPVSVIGFSANFASDKLEFIVTSSTRKPTEMRRRLESLCLSESSFIVTDVLRAILKYEVPLVKSCLESLSCSANVTLIVCNKLQNVRFFPLQIDPNARAPDQNIRPATHRAIQGTAKTPKYTVLYDDNQLTSDQLQGVTHHLCFGHQIVCLPTSLPSPVYIANRYSERGKNMHAYHLKSGLANDHQTYRELTESSLTITPSSPMFD